MLLSSLFLLALNFQLVIRGEHIRKRTNKDVLEILLDLYELNHDTYQRFFSREELKLLTEEQDLQSKGTKDEKYDFIIVGSGSAGAVVANRLTEVSEWSVLLLEAGKVENALTIVPLLAPILQFTDYNWQYLMEYQEGFAQGFEDYRLPWARGKALGGSSVINYMVYSRGHPTDYDHWASKGNPGWSYSDVLPYFLKSENSTVAGVNDTYHGTKGEWRVEDAYQGDLAKAFVESGLALGYAKADYTSAKQKGFSALQANTDRGRRHSTATAFLQTVKERSNLHVKTSARVTRVLINLESKKAHGVEYIHDGQTRKAYARKEVILCAGAFHSPQLLMLSGVGPESHLSELGIRPLVDLPVGQFLQDHIAYTGLTFVVNSTALNVKETFRGANLKQWLLTGKGPLTSLGGCQAIGLVQALTKKLDYPDVELMFFGGAFNWDYGLVTRKVMGVRDDVYYPVWEQLHDASTFSIWPVLLTPKSIGHMKLQSKNPLDAPLFYGNYLTDPENMDLKTMIRAIRFINKLVKTPPFKKYGAKLHSVPVPGCEAHKFNTDEYWECCIRSISISFHDQIGTCRMGPTDDSIAVVDSELNVYGIGHLRVADASVIPFALAGHNAATAVMIGEKAADLIKKSWD